MTQTNQVQIYFVKITNYCSVLFVLFAMHGCHFHYCKLRMSLCEYTNPFSVEKLPAIARVDLFAGLNV